MNVKLNLGHEGNHTAQKWPTSRTRWYPNISTKSGHRNVSADALPTIREDLGETRSADRMEEAIPHQDFKTGDHILCSNFRGITLLSITGKVFNRVPLNVLKHAVDPHLRDHQAGIRMNRSCTDQIATVPIILEQSLERNSPLCVSCIDWAMTFDNVDRKCLWRLLKQYGIPRKDYLHHS